MNAKYDPFTRGPFPVGVRTQELNDEPRKRKLPTEFWYPATDDYKGQDLDRETQDKYTLLTQIRQEAVRDIKLQSGCFPLILFSHGYSGHRRQTTHLCCHLASHGYIVASPDHVGNTMMEIANPSNRRSAEEMSKMALQSAIDRPKDISFLIDSILSGKTWVPQNSVDADKIGISGHSFGGWTTILATSRDERIKAALPLAPGGGDSSESEEEQDENRPLNVIHKFWNRKVGILYLTGEKDNLVALKGVIDLYKRSPQPKRMVILNNADHFHFNDGIEQVHEYFRNLQMTMRGNNLEAQILAKPLQPISELHPSKGAYEYIRGLGLAHMDAYLKNNKQAMEFLDGDLKTLLANRDIDVTLY
jgi:dienelactone hydrolase